MPLHLATNKGTDIRVQLERERRVFAAKLRAGRAVLGWSQTTLAQRTGLTQRAVHKLEQGETEPRRATVLAIEQIWREQGIAFESMADGFRLTILDAVLKSKDSAPVGRRLRLDAGVTSQHHRSGARRFA